MHARDRLSSIAERFGLDAVYVFGSRAKEILAFAERIGPLSDSPSDVDIAVLPRADKRLDARERVDIMIDLEAIFGARIDLLVLPEAPAFIAADAVSGELLYVRNRDREAEYQLFVLRRAADLAPFERERRAIVLGGGR